MTDRVRIRRLPTGVQGFDEILDGGLPEFSFNLIAGGPGCGKTTLAHQIMFANASEEKRALYFTIFGEPPIKMLRYQQQFRFFDPSKINGAIRFVHLGQEMLEGGLAKILDRITRELEATEARVVVVDSFRSVTRVSAHDGSMAMGLEGFVQTLALRLTSYEATTFLVGEYLEQESNSNPIFTVADGIIWLHQSTTRNSVVRHAQVIKMRGAAPALGLHTLRLSEEGMRVYPRLPKPSERSSSAARDARVVRKTGVVGLDEMLHGGIPVGYSVLVAGPSGSGKTVLATHFLLEGQAHGETAVLALFEKRPEEYLTTTGSATRRLDPFIREQKIELVYVRPLDLSVDEALERIKEAVARVGATRVVLDSLSGFELALAPPFRDDFRESLYRMVGALTELGVTVLMTVELTDSFTELRLSPQATSFLVDGIILQRYFEMDGSIHKAMSVIKMRARPHSKELREYEVTEQGLEVLPASRAPSGVLTGVVVAGRQTAKRKASPAPRRAAKKKTKRRG